MRAARPRPPPAQPPAPPPLHVAETCPVMLYIFYPQRTLNNASVLPLHRLEKRLHFFFARIIHIHNSIRVIKKDPPSQNIFFYLYYLAIEFASDICEDTDALVVMAPADILRNYT